MPLTLVWTRELIMRQIWKKVLISQVTNREGCREAGRTPSPNFSAVCVIFLTWIHVAHSFEVTGDKLWGKFILLSCCNKKWFNETVFTSYYCSRKNCFPKRVYSSTNVEFIKFVGKYSLSKVSRPGRRLNKPLRTTQSKDRTRLSLIEYFSSM